MNPRPRQLEPEALPPASPARPGEPVAGKLERWVGSRAALALVLAIAAGLRVAHILAIQKLPLDILVIDSAVYDLWAERIAGGDWLGTGVFYQDPLYPYFLAALYRTFGRDVLLVRLVQAGLGVGTCALVAVIASRAAGACRRQPRRAAPRGLRARDLPRSGHRQDGAGLVPHDGSPRPGAPPGHPGAGGGRGRPRARGAHAREPPAHRARSRRLRSRSRRPSATLPAATGAPGSSAVFGRSRRSAPWLSSPHSRWC